MLFDHSAREYIKKLETLQEVWYDYMGYVPVPIKPVSMRIMIRRIKPLYV